MSQSPTVSYSGASFTSLTPKAPQQQHHNHSSAHSNTTQKVKELTRTIIETSHCPPELRRGSEGWSFHDLKVQRALGEGAMSTVVQCLCNRSGMLLALKMYHKERLNTLNVRQVAREIEIHASLSHQNVIKLYAAFEDTDGIYLVQEYAAGGDLYAELSRHGGYMLEAHVVKNVLGPFLDALCHLHERGILHRDIKPENILLTEHGEIKVADFGLAINTLKEKPMSRVGTLDYMPPEIAALPRPGAPSTASHHPSLSPTASNASSLSKQPTASSPLGQPPHPQSLSPTQQQLYTGNYGLPADIWCIGILAYELLVGGPPFEAETKEATYTRIIKTEPTIPSNLSQEARDFIACSLNKDPSKRPSIEQLMVHPWLRPAAMVYRSHSRFSSSPKDSSILSQHSPGSPTASSGSICTTINNGISANSHLNSKKSMSPPIQGLAPGLAPSVTPVPPSSLLGQYHDFSNTVSDIEHSSYGNFAAAGGGGGGGLVKPTIDQNCCHVCAPPQTAIQLPKSAKLDDDSSGEEASPSSIDSKGSSASLFSMLVRTPTASESPARPRSRILSSYFKKLSGRILSSGRSRNKNNNESSSSSSSVETGNR